jgi:hypothetical protein
MCSSSFVFIGKLLRDLQLLSLGFLRMIFIIVIIKFKSLHIPRNLAQAINFLTYIQKEAVWKFSRGTNILSEIIREFPQTNKKMQEYYLNQVTVIRNRLNIFNLNKGIQILHVERTGQERNPKHLMDYDHRGTGSIGLTKLRWKDQPSLQTNGTDPEVQTLMLMIEIKSR